MPRKKKEKQDVKPVINKGGRPKKEIDQDQFEKLCEWQCTQSEICEWFGITDKTLTRWCKETYGVGFSEVFKVKRQKGLISLRRSQFELAKKNATLSIWLGKQYLGQRNIKEEEW
jgi:hypothetical protein